MIYNRTKIRAFYFLILIMTRLVCGFTVRLDHLGSGDQIGNIYCITLHFGNYAKWTQ